MRRTHSLCADASRGGSTSLALATSLAPTRRTQRRSRVEPSCHPRQCTDAHAVHARPGRRLPCERRQPRLHSVLRLGRSRAARPLCAPRRRAERDAPPRAPRMVASPPRQGKLRALQEASRRLPIGAPPPPSAPRRASTATVAGEARGRVGGASSCRQPVWEPPPLGAPCPWSGLGEEGGRMGRHAWALETLLALGLVEVGHTPTHAAPRQRGLAGSELASIQMCTTVTKAAVQYLAMTPG